METNYKHLFYIGIAQGVCSERRRIPKAGGDSAGASSRRHFWEGKPSWEADAAGAWITGKSSRAIYSQGRLIRELPYLLGEGRPKPGKLRICYALLPEYRRKRWIDGKPLPWKKDARERLIGEILTETWQRPEQRLQQRPEQRPGHWPERRLEQRLGQMPGQPEILISPQLGGDPGNMPSELLAACLYRHRPFDRLCVCLPEEGGEACLEQALELMAPYLPRMRQVMLAGREGSLSEKLEDYLYGEFGIVMTKEYRIPAEVPCLDLSEETTEIPAGKFSERHGKDRRLISRGEAWKFLDTLVKNGYNTEVNQE